MMGPLPPRNETGPAAVRLMGALISVNPNLRTSLGHSVHQDRCLRIEAAKRGWRFGGLVHADCAPDILAEGGYTPCFRVMMHQVARSSGRERLRLAGAVAREWAEGYTRHVESQTEPQGEEQVFFQYLGHAATLPYLAERLEEHLFGRPGSRIVVNLFSGYFERPLEGGGQREFLEAGVALQAIRELPWLRPVTDSPRLSADLEKATGWILPVLPMMPSQELGHPEVKSATPSRRRPWFGGQNPVEVVFPTHAEPGRGFDFLRTWLESLPRSSPWRGRIHLTIRQHAPWRTDLPPVPPSDANVTWIEGDLSGPSYREMLASADVVLLPYSPVDFHYRTSSILAEAFSLGKPVICVGGSWLADQVRAVDGGWILAELSAAELERVFAAVLARRDRLRPWPGRDSMNDWLRDNSVPAFLSSVLSESRPGGRLEAVRFLPWLWEEPL